MRRLEAPKGVLDAFAHMGLVVEQDTLADRDVKKMLKLVKRVQELLG
jgi:hypothetical protein